MTKHTILNLGAGVQSTAIFLLMHDGEMEPADYALFADTGEESAAVYRHLDWLESLNSAVKIVRLSAASRLGDDLINGTNSTNQRFASIPAYTSTQRGQEQGMTPRQCTSEYKIRPIETWIRRELIGLKPKQHMPKGVQTMQYFGFSTDEAGRAARTRLRFKQVRWGEVDFPLFWEDFQMTRNDCQNYLRGRVPHEVENSVCTFCPYQSNRQWLALHQRNPEGWQRSVEVDRAMREADARCSQGLDSRLYVHRQCVPLDEANLDEAQKTLFDMECEGGCGL